MRAERTPSRNNPCITECPCPCIPLPFVRVRNSTSPWVVPHTGRWVNREEVHGKGGKLWEPLPLAPRGARFHSPVASVGCHVVSMEHGPLFPTSHPVRGTRIILKGGHPCARPRALVLNTMRGDTSTCPTCYPSGILGVSGSRMKPRRSHKPLHSVQSPSVMAVAPPTRGAPREGPPEWCATQRTHTVCAHRNRHQRRVPPPCVPAGPFSRTEIANRNRTSHCGIRLPIQPGARPTDS